jgi:hypothetical protein
MLWLIIVGSILAYLFLGAIIAGLFIRWDDDKANSRGLAALIIILWCIIVPIVLLVLALWAIVDKIGQVKAKGK